MSNVQTLFKDPIYIVDDLVSNITQLKNDCYSIYNHAQQPKYHDNYNPGTTFVSYKFKPEYAVIHKDTRFTNFSNLVFDHCKQFMLEIGYNRQQIDRLFISRSWFNISCENDYMERHVHPATDFTSVFYIESTPDDKITFVKNVYNMLERPKDMNQWSRSVFDLDAKPNRLAIFKADQVHNVSRDRLSDKRITFIHNFTLANR